MTIALTLGLTRSMRARCAAITSRADTSLRRMRAASSTALRSHSSSSPRPGVVAWLGVCAKAEVGRGGRAPASATAPSVWLKTRRETTSAMITPQRRQNPRALLYSVDVHDLLRLSPEVVDALHQNRPIVALESTLITLGLSWPANAETALAMERAVRECGAMPATIAVLGGQITVGLSPDQINDLAQRPPGSVRKCSTRDLPIAVGRGEDASTTVAATMIVAHKAGLKVFATVGSAGLSPLRRQDVLADLIELVLMPVAVVCAGAKAILDLPFTLEVLETQGVPIVGLGTDTLPGFGTRSSGLPIDTRVETPREAAAIIAASRRLGLERAVIIAVPVPEDHEFAGAEAAIARGHSRSGASRHSRKARHTVSAETRDGTDRGRIANGKQRASRQQRASRGIDRARVVHDERWRRDVI